MSIITKNNVGFAVLKGLSLKSLITAALAADQAYRSRRHVERLDARLLDDAGLSKN